MVQRKMLRDHEGKLVRATADERAHGIYRIQFLQFLLVICMICTTCVNTPEMYICTIVICESVVLGLHFRIDAN